jgi:uncharacterized protein
MSQATAPAARTPDEQEAAKPWWRVPMVWVVVSGPASVVVASFASAVIAWKHIDPVINVAPGITQHAGDDVAEPARPHDALAPALKARNHVATPQQ